MLHKIRWSRFYQTHYIFAFIAVVFGLIFAYVTPPLWGIDETSHFARVYQLSKGDFLPNVGEDNYGGRLPTNLVKLIDYTKGDLLNNEKTGLVSRKDADDIRAYREFTDSKFSEGQQSYILTSTYSPVAYIGPVVGVFLAGIFDATIGQTIFVARLFSLFLYITIVFFVLKLLQTYKIKWVFFIVALLPAVLFQAAVVTADNMAISLSLLFTALFLRLNLERKNDNNKRLFFVLTGLAILLPLIKVNYIFISLAIVVTPDKLLITSRLTTIVKLVGVMVATILGLLWSSLTRVTAGAPISPRPDGVALVPADQISFILNQPLQFIVTCAKSVILNLDPYLRSLTSIVGWNFVSIPVIFIVVLCLGIFISAMNAKEELAHVRTKLFLFTGLIAIGVASIFAALYVGFTPTGSRVVEGVQGRYFLPFLVPVILALSILPLEVRIKENQSRLIFSLIVLSGLLSSVVYYYFITY